MRGRHSVVLSIRIAEDVQTIIKELADKKGVSISAFIKGKVEELAVNTIEVRSRSVNRKDEEGESVNTTATPFHSVHKKEDVPKPVHTMKDVLTDKDGKHYKLIGGVRCRIKE